MTLQKLFVIGATFIVAAGCWSVGSNAEPTSRPVDRETSTTSVTPTPKVSPKETPKMTPSNQSGGFLANLPKDFEQPTDAAGKLLLREYGSLFVARNGAIPPKKVVFRDEADVTAYQNTLQRSTETIGPHKVELQAAAMTALKEAIAEARSAGSSITPRGADSARRSYTHTVTLWASRVNPGLTYWVGKGRITAADAKRIKALTPFQQVPEILALEPQGIYFAKDLSKSIIYSVAPPGTSQHLSMLALDVAEFDNARVRAILANHGWFQTVSSDLPHFTYLGVTEAELPGLGLKQATNSGRTFWVPDI